MAIAPSAMDQAFTPLVRYQPEFQIRAGEYVKKRLVCQHPWICGRLILKPIPVLAAVPSHPLPVILTPHTPSAILHAANTLY